MSGASNKAEITASASAPAVNQSRAVLLRDAADSDDGHAEFTSRSLQQLHICFYRIGFDAGREERAKRYIIRALPYRLMRQRAAIIARHADDLVYCLTARELPPHCRPHRPRCTPSASTCAASCASSFTMKVVLNSRVKCAQSYALDAISAPHRLICCGTAALVRRHARPNARDATTHLYPVCPA